jgi:hypothetical protein
MVERRMGGKRYLAFYICCGVFGGIMYLTLNLLGSVFHLRLPGLLFEDPNTPLIGASAGVFGVLMAAAYYEPNALMQVMFLPITVRLRTLVYVYVGLAAANLLFGAQSGGNRGGDAAHMGGALAGWFFVRRQHLLGDFFDVLGPPRAAKRGARGGKRVSEDEVDRALAKVATQGLHSLSESEKAALRRATEARQG